MAGTHSSSEIKTMKETTDTDNCGNLQSAIFHVWPAFPGHIVQSHELL